MFSNMAPQMCTCIIGNYRGTESCPELVDCPVGVDHDRNLGVPPAIVGIKMRAFEEQCNRIMFKFTEWLNSDAGRSTVLEDRIKKFAVEAAKLFESFLTIHPYMDGNGHCARLLLFRLATWAGFPPRNWDIDKEFPIYEEISLHRSAERRGPLMRQLTQHILEVM